MSLQALGETGIEQLQINKNILLDKFVETDQNISLISNQKFLPDLDPKSLNNELISLDFHPLTKRYKSSAVYKSTIIHKDRN